MDEGIYTDLDIEEYHRSSGGISNSGIKLILDCPKRYYHEYLSGKPKREKSADFILGDAIEMKIFEPEKFDSLYIPLPETFKIKSGKAFEEFERTNTGKHILSRSDYEKVMKTAEAVCDNWFFKAVRNDGKIQQSYFWKDDNGVLLKSRPDWISDDFIIDLKSTKDVSPKGFQWAIRDYGYDMQAYMQLEGTRVLTGKTRKHVLLVVEKTEPYIVQAYTLKEEHLTRGEENCKNGAFIYQQCLENNYWPGYDDSILEI